MKENPECGALEKRVAELEELIARQNQTEKMLKDSEEKYKRLYFMMRMICDNVPDMIWAKDMDQKYIFTNKAMCENLLNVKNTDEPVGKTDFDFMPHEVAENFQKSDLAALKNGYISDEIKFENWSFHVVKQRLSDSDEKDIGITAVIRDTTDIKREKSEKIELEKKLRQSQKLEAIGTLAGGISHDFNNILTAILGYTEIALEEVDGESGVRELLDEVYNAGIRARDLVKQILAFARQTEQELKPIRLDLIAKEALKLIRSTVPTTIEIVHYFKSKSLVMADPVQIHQIIMNLCGNAAHAMEAEGGTLKVSIKDAVLGPQITDHYPDLVPGFFLKLEVEDTGVGIEEKILDSIFEPYFTTKESGEGTGLGLAVVHGIVKSYGGEVFVTSQVGKGSLFKIYLPVIKSIGTEKRFDPTEVLMGSEHILFVDDEVTIARLGQRMLESLGYRVTTRTSSIEALELFKYRADIFDLVITDMTMPNMTGDRLSFEMMKIRPDIPVILCTGYSKKFSDVEALENGIKAFQMKPLIKKELAKTVRKVLDDAGL
ncbi:MAG: response regulator [Desulfobacteraceae bacterium]|nr:response regulator [Desulfobacteraceae bacterium]MBC2755025.1 response regulator [Desulfobacteraceae bacterium]